MASFPSLIFSFYLLFHELVFRHRACVTMLLRTWITKYIELSRSIHESERERRRKGDTDRPDGRVRHVRREGTFVTCLCVFPMLRVMVRGWRCLFPSSIPLISMLQAYNEESHSSYHRSTCMHAQASAAAAAGKQSATAAAVLPMPFLLSLSII